MKKVNITYRQLVENAGILDTRKYRYVMTSSDEVAKRLPIKALNTTEALVGWEYVELRRA